MAIGDFAPFSLNGNPGQKLIVFSPFGRASGDILYEQLWDGAMRVMHIDFIRTDYSVCQNCLSSNVDKESLTANEISTLRPIIL